MYMTSKHWENGTKAAFLLFFFIVIQAFHVTPSTDLMGCKYGERGSLTAICTNATANLFKDTIYRFDHLDETLICVNCTLTTLGLGTFDINGNRIQILNISHSRIESIQEKSFMGLVFLEKLILSYNSISSFQVGAFHGVRKIEKIYLDNALTAPLPSFAFQNLWLLKELYLNNNLLTSLEQKTFFGLESLEILDLSQNKLKIVNESLSNLNNLKLVLLNNNEIFQISQTDFRSLPNLLHVNLANNLIGILNFNFTEPSSLRKLNLSNNYLGNEVVKIGTFEYMYNLEILDLSLNWFKVIPPKLFQGLYNLRELILCRNAISDFQSGAFSGLPSLRLINVSHNNIDKAIITGTLSLRQLHVIDFFDNKISDFDVVRFLQRAPIINIVDLRSNLLSCEKRRKVEAYFKNESVRIKMDLENCPPLDKGHVVEMFKELEDEFISLETTNAIATLKVLLVLILLVLVGALFYIHFYVLRRRGY